MKGLKDIRRQLETIDDEIEKHESHKLILYNSIYPGNYIILPTQDTYAFGVHNLIKTYSEDPGNYQDHPLFDVGDGSKIPRPLIFKEQIEARVIDYETVYDKNGKRRSREID